MEEEKNHGKKMYVEIGKDGQHNLSSKSINYKFIF